MSVDHDEGRHDAAPSGGGPGQPDGDGAARGGARGSRSHRGRVRARSAVRSALVLGGALLAAFTLARAILLVAYPSSFAELGAVQIARAFLWGLRFDVSMMLLVVGVPLWLMTIPAAWARWPAWQRPLRAIAYGLAVVCLFVIAADLVYFSVARRHLGSELALTLRDDWQAAFRMPFEYPLPLAAFLAAAAGLALLWKRSGDGARGVEEPVPVEEPGRPAGATTAPWKRWALWAAFLPVAVIGIRGGFQYKPLNIVNAFRFGSVAEGYLTLNGPFSAYHSARNTRDVVEVSPLPTEELVEMVRSRYARDDQEWVSDRYPLERRPSAPGDDAPWREGPVASGPPNVVVLVLESWDALLTDAIRRQKGLEPLGITPNFDALAREGLLFTRFLASGQLSIEGLAALLASVPTVPGMPYMGTGLEQSRLSFLGEIAGTQGYDRVFVRSARRGSFRLDAVAALAGFETYAGAEDILQLQSHTTEPHGYWGAWDFDSFRHFHQLLMEADPPFLGFFFGSSTHQPYPSPGDQWERFPPTSRKNRFLNNVHYVDWAMGQYLEMAKQAGYFDNTLFVILADQTSAFVTADDPLDRHWIPALLVGPGIPQGETDGGIASQMDIVPTVIDYLGWDVTHASFGESLLGPRRQNALLKNGDTVIRVNGDRWVVHDLARRLDEDGSETVVAELERALLAEVQLIKQLVATNRVFSGGRGPAE